MNRRLGATVNKKGNNNCSQQPIQLKKGRLRQVKIFEMVMLTKCKFQHNVVKAF